MATRKRSVPPPPPPSAWEVVWREVQIAGVVASAITLVLLARRWTQKALGTGTLNQEFFAGNLAVGTLVAAVENRIAGGACERSARPARTRVSGGADDDNGES